MELIHKTGQTSEFGPQGRTEYLVLKKEKEKTSVFGPQGRTEIWRWPTRKDREHLELTHRTLNLNPQGEDRTSESGQVGL